MMGAAFLLWTMTWLPPAAMCDGSPLFPDGIVYVLPYLLLGMALGPACPLDEAGQPQPCASVVEWGEFEAGAALSFSSDAVPTPPIGQVYQVVDPIAENPAGRCEP